MKNQINISFLLIVFFTIPLIISAQIQVEELLCENRINPIGIDNIQPKLTWVLSSTKRNKSQSAYRIQVSESENQFSGHVVWDSDKINSNQSVKVPYKGPELKTLQKYYWRVKVWDESGKSSPWSTVSNWQMGIMNVYDWKVKWIGVGYEESKERESPIFRNEFDIVKQIKKATVTITAHGLYEAYINGNKIGDAYLAPGWTSYNKRLQYQVYDVTKMLKTGKNAVGAILGSGWYRGVLAWGDNKNHYGSDLALLLQINITYTDGSSEIIGSNMDWKSYKSEILYSEIYNGETIDARKTMSGWKNPNFDDSQWPSAVVKTIGFDNLIATYNEPVKKHETFSPKEQIITPEGDTILDFGQNLVGWVEVDINGRTGDSLILDHAEVLDKQGNFYTENLRAAKEQNIYILKGGDTEHFRPHFTWQGFRYIRIKGTIKTINKDNFTAVTLYSDMRKTGNFSTSNDLLNQLQHNIQWGQYGNFLDVPTDCPQRDERLGWTGDAQVFTATASYNMNVDNFFCKWMKDVAADQLPNGSVPWVIPNVLGENESGSAGWADAATIIPWNLYLYYGNEDILKSQYASMKAWVEYMKSKSHDYLWNSGFHFGDWLFYRPDDDNDGRSAVTDKYFITQCFYAHSTQLLINAAKVLEKNEDVQNYEELLNKIKAAFKKEYVTPNGRLTSNSQTAYVLALNFDMLPEALRQQAADRLAENVKSYNYHLTTGFLGTSYLCAVLSKYGYQDLAYTLLMQQSYPSWLYPVTAGATTIWERWDGRKPNGDFQFPTMNSFNHYAYGAIGHWMYTNLAGINTSMAIGETGHKKIILTPHFNNEYVSDEVKNQNHDQTLTEVNADLETYYGKIKSHWKKDKSKIFYKVNIPVNTTAEIHLPVQIESIHENGVAISKSKDIKTKKDKEGLMLLLGSGEFTFLFNE